jgi:regulator of protease activity HflC (stomatin/prohibitin superfamily)
MCMKNSLIYHVKNGDRGIVLRLNRLDKTIAGPFEYGTEGCLPALQDI